MSPPADPDPRTADSPAGGPAPGAPLVVICEEIDEECVRWLAERCTVERCPPEDRARLDALLPRAEGLIVRTYTRVGPAELARAPRLRVVGRAGVGLDNIDLPACRGRGVAVVHTPDANTRAVAELVAAFMLDVLRPRLFLDRALPGPEWRTLRSELTAPRQLAGLTLGVLGLGRVGRAVARIGAAFDMRTLYHDLLDIPADRRAGAEPVPMDDLLASADVLSVHVDDRPSNARLIDARALSLMKRDAVLINTSRGFVADTPALAAWLRERPSAAAVLDVHDPEPIREDCPLLGLPNAHLSPHIGAATRDAHRNMSWVVRDVWRVLSGGAPQGAPPEPRTAER